MQRFWVTTILGFVLAALVATSALGAPTQPGQVGNAEGRSGGATTTGPHCHFVVPASGNASSFDMIITAAIHEGHIRSGLNSGPFRATACP